MSTRSLIAVKNNKGTYTAIYCHNCGEPTGVGKTLVEHYDDPEKVKELLAVGDINWLGNTTYDPGDLWKMDYEWVKHPELREKIEEYTNNPDFTRTYASLGHPARTREYDSIADMYTYFGYVYVWDRANGWRVKCDDHRLRKVANVLKNAKQAA